MGPNGFKMRFFKFYEKLTLRILMIFCIKLWQHKNLKLTQMVLSEVNALNFSDFCMQLQQHSNDFFWKNLTLGCLDKKTPKMNFSSFKTN